jgi:DNA-binding HxlR family transcriptional regulator
MRSYGQFCPVAKAAEIVAERWTPLVLRELLMGSHRFNEIHAGVPRMPRSLLVQRLRTLERADLLERRPGPRGGALEYHLTPAGQALLPVIEQLGQWGQRWLNGELAPHEIDPDLLVWDMHRRLHLDRLPARRVVMQLDLGGLCQRSYWLVADRHEASVCRTDPGFEIDLLVTADTLALHQVWTGRRSLADAMRAEQVQVEGPRDLARAFPGWLALGYFAGLPSPPPGWPSPGARPPTPRSEVPTHAG